MKKACLGEGRVSGFEAASSLFSLGSRLPSLDSESLSLACHLSRMHTLPERHLRALAWVSLWGDRPLSCGLPTFIPGPWGAPPCHAHGANTRDSGRKVVCPPQCHLGFCFFDSLNNFDLPLFDFKSSPFCLFILQPYFLSGLAPLHLLLLCRCMTLLAPPPLLRSHLSSVSSHRWPDDAAGLSHEINLLCFVLICFLILLLLAEQC